MLRKKVDGIIELSQTLSSAQFSSIVRTPIRIANEAVA
jgi:hypothetical protein